MKVTLWGVRGTVPISEIDKMKTGGNTTCVEVQVDDQAIIIFDAGTGIVPLGRNLLKRFKDRPLPPIHIFISHTHWDHLYGFSFFGALFQKKAKINIYGVNRKHGSLEQIIMLAMDDAFCPICYQTLPADIHFFEMKEPVYLLGGVKISAGNHMHPGGALGYRVEANGKIFVFNTDVEHYPTHIDERVVVLSKEADLMIHDAQYTEEQIMYKVAWGHSTWQQAINVAQQANVKMLGFTHHDPNRTDEEIDDLEKQAQKVFDNSFFCRENTSIIL